MKKYFYHISLIVVLAFSGCSDSNISQNEPYNTGSQSILNNEPPQEIQTLKEALLAKKDAETSENIKDTVSTESLQGTKISRLTNNSEIEVYPSISGKYVAWDQRIEKGDEKDDNVFLMNTATLDLNRVGYLKDLFGNDTGAGQKDYTTNDKIDQILARVNQKYIIWAEKPSSADTYSLYYSPIASRLDKKLISTDASNYYYLVGNKILYNSNRQEEANKLFTVFDLDTGKQTYIPDVVSDQMITYMLYPQEDTIYFISSGQKKADTPEDENSFNEALQGDNSLYSLKLDSGKVDRVWHIGNLAIKDGTDVVLTRLGFRIINNRLYYAEYDTFNKVTSIKEVSLESKTEKTLISGLKATWDQREDTPHFAGLIVSDLYLVWAVMYSKNAQENGLFAYDFSNGKTADILADGKVKLAWDYFWIPGIDIGIFPSIEGSRLVFPGYEGDYSENGSNVELYLADIKI